MAKDPVCGMEVDERDAGFCTRFEHETYYLCAKACQDHFEREEGIQHSEPGKKWWQKILKEPEEKPPKCH